MGCAVCGQVSKRAAKQQPQTPRRAGGGDRGPPSPGGRLPCRAETSEIKQRGSRPDRWAGQPVLSHQQETGGNGSQSVSAFFHLHVHVDIRRTVPPATGPWNRDQGFLGIPPSTIAGLGAVISQITPN